MCSGVFFQTEDHKVLDTTVIYTLILVSYTVATAGQGHSDRSKAVVHQGLALRKDTAIEMNKAMAGTSNSVVRGQISTT